MDIGKLNKRILIQRQTTVTDDEGYQQQEWQDIAKLWAYCSPYSAREYHLANSTTYKKTIKFNIRYTRNIDNTMRIKYNDKIYNILSIENVDEANREMWLLGEVVE